MKNPPQKTILEAIRNCGFREIETGVRICFMRFSTAEYTPAWLEAINATAGEIVRQYRNEGEISLGPMEGCITLGNVPFDVLPCIPLVFHEISSWSDCVPFKKSVKSRNLLCNITHYQFHR